MRESLTFIIPVYHDDPSELIKKISTIFSKYQIIIVDDGANIKETFDNTLIIRNTQNLGLAKSLIVGYEQALKHKSKFIIRIDADDEYPIESVSETISQMKNDNKLSLIGFKRTVKSNGIIDSIFNWGLGIIEGILLTNTSFPQHAPSLQIFEYSLLAKILPKLKGYALTTNINWGLDLVSVAYASKLTDIKVVKSENPDWFERRPIKKILSQFKSSITILFKFILNRL